MRDVQNQADARGIAIQQVGIKDAHLPFLIKTKEGGFQQVLARIRFTVALPSEYKGTHMSRFLETVQRHAESGLDYNVSKKLMEELREHLHAEPNVRFRRSHERPHGKQYVRRDGLRNAEPREGIEPKRAGRFALVREQRIERRRA